MGDKWDEIDTVLKDAIVKDYKKDPAALGDLIKVIHKIIAVLRSLDERYGGCNQRAEWKLYSHCADFVSYSCTAHLSLMAGANAEFINALDVDVERDCCYRE